MGAPYYAAPEQHRGERVDRRADVYALGCVLFEMLTGRVPFSGPTSMAVAVAHCSDAPPSPARVNGSVPAAFDGVIAKALAKDPDDRYQTTGELGAAAVAAASANQRPPSSAAQETVIAPSSSGPALVGSAGPDAGAAHSSSPGGGAAPERTSWDMPASRTAAPRPEPQAADTGRGRARRGRLRWWAAIAAVAVIALAAVIAVVLTGRSGGSGGSDGGGRSGEGGRSTSSGGIPATVTPADGANVRVSPHGALAAAALPGGSQVTVSCTADGWDRLKQPDPGGYVYAPLLKAQAAVPPCPQQP